MHNAKGLQLESRKQEFVQNAAWWRQDDLGLVEALFTNISRDNSGAHGDLVHEQQRAELPSNVTYLLVL